MSLDVDSWASNLFGDEDFLPPPEPEPEPEPIKLPPPVKVAKPAPVQVEDKPRPEPAPPPKPDVFFKYPHNENRKGNPVPKEQWKAPAGRKPGNPGLKRSYTFESKEIMKERFLEAYRTGLTVAQVAELIDVPYYTLLQWRKVDPQFYQDWMAITIETRVDSDAQKERVKADFLANYEAHMNMGQACRYAGVTRHELNAMMSQDPDFKVAVQEMRDACLDNVETSLYDKAMSGGKGSETAAAILLNAFRPERYKRQAAVTQEAEGGNVVFNFFLSAAPAVKQLPASSEKELVLDAEAAD